MEQGLINQIRFFIIKDINGMKYVPEKYSDIIIERVITKFNISNPNMVELKAILLESLDLYHNMQLQLK